MNDFLPWPMRKSHAVDQAFSSWGSRRCHWVPMHDALAGVLRDWRLRPIFGGWVFGSPVTNRPTTPTRCATTT